MAYLGTNKTILSSIQLEDQGIKVDDKASHLLGNQMITTSQGFCFPLAITNGLAYLEMRPYTQQEYQDCPHVIMTSDQIWNPGSMMMILILSSSRKLFQTTCICYPIKITTWLVNSLVSTKLNSTALLNPCADSGSLRLIIIELRLLLDAHMVPNYQGLQNILRLHMIPTVPIITYLDRESIHHLQLIMRS